jgi:uncharacterized protein (TIRG00374 family)
VRPAVVFGTNLVVGGAALAWVLHRFGVPALGILARAPSAWLIVVFGCAVAAGFAVPALRWQILLAGLGVRRRLGALTAYRAAGQSVSALIPSAKLGGEPMRVYLLLRARVAAPTAIASVVVDRTLDMGAAAVFAFLFALVLVRRDVPALAGAFVSVLLGVVALALGTGLTVRRLRSGAGLVTAAARATGLERLRAVHGRMDTLAAAETAAASLVADPRRLARAFGVGVVANTGVLLEYHLLLAAFGLPAGPLAVVAAIFAAGAAHSLPVPAAVGTLEGAQMFLFTTLGYPPEVGLAVGLAVRLREVVWIVPGLVYLLGRGMVPYVRRPHTPPPRSPG